MKKNIYVHTHPGGAVVKNPLPKAGVMGLIPGFRRLGGKVHWRKKWQPTPVLWLGNPMRRGNWWAIVCGGGGGGHKESDTTDHRGREHTHIHMYYICALLIDR